jgi:hypothetical protein
MITLEFFYSRSWHNLVISKHKKKKEAIKSFYFKMLCIETKIKFAKVERNEFQFVKIVYDLSNLI